MRVKRLFVMETDKSLIAHLESFEWDFTLGRAVELDVRGVRIAARQVGSGNHQGVPVLLLKPSLDWNDVMVALRGLPEGPETDCVRLTVSTH